MGQIEPKNLYRYTLADRIGVIVAQPIGESDFTIEWSRDNDNGKRVYGKEFGGNIMFTGEAYLKLLKMETSIYRCEYQSVTIERSCVTAGVRTWAQWFVGQISLNDGEWDLDGCNVTMKFEEEKPDQCFEDNKNEKINLFQETFQRRTLNMFPGNVTVETKDCNDIHGTSGEFGGYYWCEEGEPYDTGWVAFYHREQRFGTEYQVNTRWARQVMVLPCDSDIPVDWILLEESCPGGNRTYAKPVNIYDCKYTYGDNYDPEYYQYTMDCQIFGQSSSGTVFDNGIPLEDVITAFVQKYCPSIVVKSDFFQINPDVATDINYVTGSKSKVRYITVYQKSDVKRPNAAGNAFKMEWSFEKLMITLKYMFNVEWRIDAGKFIIEHVKFYQKNAGLNLMLPRYAKYIKGKRKYSYKNDSIPKQEKWTWKEQNYSGDFPGTPIVYEGCVTSGSKDSIKTYAIEDVMTDVEYAISNPAPDNTRVTDDGLVFMAAERTGTVGSYVYNIITEAGILEGSRINNSLALAQLMRDYHQYERPLKIGRLNNVNTEFQSVIPTKKGETIAVPFCCEDQFNPDDLIASPLGNGVVDKATFNFKDSTLELELLYEANVGLVFNTPPVAVNEVVTTYEAEPIIIDVLANDSDADPDATVLSMEIMYPPAHGTAEVMPDFKIKYSPNVAINLFDKTAIIPGFYVDATTGALIVSAPSSVSQWIPIVYGQTHKVSGITSGTTWRFRNAGGALIKPVDATGTPLALWGGGLITAGVIYAPAGAVEVQYTTKLAAAVSDYNTIQIQRGAIATAYKPFVGFTDYVGNDLFTYRYKDNWGQPSNNALVSITVRPANTAPVANDDNYSVFAGNVLNIGAPGIFGNDVDDFGFVLDAYDAVSAQGGTVVVQPTGAFTYTHPVGYLGADSFTYRIKDDKGMTSTATVNIMVRNINYPIANPDSYETKTGVALVVDGIAPKVKVTANDTTPAGGTPTYTVTAETKATAQGGSVTLNSDGTFTYTPPVGFTGDDSFTYTVDNGAGTDVGTVTIHVLPDIYVRMVQDDYQQEFLEEPVCPPGSFPPPFGGEIETYDFTFEFFSDAAGTIPLDVTGLGLKLNIEEAVRNAPSGSWFTYNYQISNPYGSSFVYLNDYQTLEDRHECDNIDYYSERTLTLMPGVYTII